MKKIQDHYFRKAKQEGYQARSVYKLKEAQETYGFLRKGQTVLDLGAYPGSWAQYVIEVIGPTGYLVAVDLAQPQKFADNMVPLKKDVMELEAGDLLAIRPIFHVVLSDMAPRTSGHRAVDHLRSMTLARKALELACAITDKEGAFFCKVFQGGDFPAFMAEVKKAFVTARIVKPKSSRAESVEIFVLGMERRM